MASVGLDPLGESRLDGQLVIDPLAQVRLQAPPVDVLHRVDPELRRRHAQLVGVCGGGEHVQPVERQHPGHLTEGAGGVRAHDRDQVLVAVDVHLTGGHLRHRVGVGEQLPPPDRLVLPAEHVTGPLDEFGDQPLLPGVPRRRPGRLRVGDGQRVQQLERADVTGEVGDELRGRGIRDVATHGDVGEQQVVLDHRHEGRDVRLAVAQPRCDALDQLHPDLGVVARIPLADVVEEGAEHEEIRTIDRVGELGGVGRGLPQVPVHGEAVVRVSLRPRSIWFPLGQDA